MPSPKYKCIDSKWASAFLTLGKDYEGMEAGKMFFDGRVSDWGPFVLIRCDDTVLRWLPLRRFKKLADEKEPQLEMDL